MATGQASRATSPPQDHGDSRRTRRGWRGRNGLIALAATATLGAGLLSGGATAYADSPLDGVGDITSILENPLLLDYVEMCDNPDGSTPVPEDETVVYAVADCSKSTGTGIAVVLPESIEVGTTAENMSYKLPVYGTRNFIQIVSMLALDEYVGSPTYSTYEQIQADAALDVVIGEQKVCVKYFLGFCTKSEIQTVDINLAKRTRALKVAQYLTNEQYDKSKKVTLPDQISPVGNATVVGPGIQLALAMTGGNALAETGHKLGIATAGAGGGRTSKAYSYIGMANALNIDSDQIKLTWFGQELDFTKLKGNALVKLIGSDKLGDLEAIEDLEIPALKEVSCYGVYATATADGLGSCTNLLGTFDVYKDLRAPKVGESRQTQYGLTDVTSLVMGNDALLKQLNGTSENTPFMDDLMKNLTSEDDRLKFAKDFVRFTQDVKTEAVTEPKLDDEGSEVLDGEGNVVMVPTVDEDGKPITKTITAAYLTSDYGLKDPVTIEWMGQRVVLFPAVTVNGEERPNLMSLPQIEKIVADADSGEMPKISLLPKVSLVQFNNPFGLGTLKLDKPFDPAYTLKNFFKSVTIVDDVKEIGGLVGGLTGSTGIEDADETTEGTEGARVAGSSAASTPAANSTSASTSATSAPDAKGQSSAVQPTTPKATPTPSPSATKSEAAGNEPTTTDSATSSASTTANKPASTDDESAE